METNENQQIKSSLLGGKDFSEQTQYYYL